MSGSARVSSLDALRQLKEALCAFGVDAQEALGVAAMEIRRTQEWLREQLKHWQRVVRERQEELARAKSELAQRRWGYTEGRGPGTTEQEIAVRDAQQRLRQAEDKVETVRRWILQLPREVNEYEGPARSLAGLVDADLRHAVAVLDNKLAALEAYVALAPPPGAAPAPAEAGVPPDSPPPPGADAPRSP
jgi:hypothetical protein